MSWQDESERAFEHEIYKEVGNEASRAMRRWKYGNDVDFEGFNHHARKEDNKDSLDEGVQNLIKAQYWLSREIELRQDFHVKYKQRWEERGHENGIHKGILEQISLKKGLMERLERDIASCEAEIAYQNAYQNKRYNEDMMHRARLNETMDNDLSLISSNTSNDTAASQKSYSVECKKSALDFREADEYWTKHLGTYIEEDITIRKYPYDQEDSPLSNASLRTDTAQFSLDDLQSQAFSWGIDTDLESVSSKVSREAFSQGSLVENSLLQEDEDIQAQENDPAFPSRPSANSIVSERDLAKLSFSISRAGVRKRGLGPPRHEFLD